METKTQTLSKKNCLFGLVAGLLIGLLALPVLKTAKPILYDKFALMIVPFFLIATPFGLVVAYFISKKIAVVWQLGKFVVTGTMNALVDIGTLALLIYAFKNYLSVNPEDLIWSGLAFLSFYSIYKAISFIIANINSYYWNKYWTFNQDSQKKSEFIQFFIVSVIGFFINVAVASFVFKLITPVGGLNFEQWGLVGAVAGSIAGLAWNFLGYKFIVFKK